MKRLRSILLALAAMAAVLMLPAFALTPDEVLADPALEERARAISARLRCLVCQNQSIDDSDADLARDLRVLVRERLMAGDTDEEVIDFIVARYGEFVLLQPRFSVRNAALWATPVVLLVAGGAFLLLATRRQRAPGAGGLTAEEDAALEKLLRSGE